MLNKTLTIIIDDFSDRVFEYDNVTLYDYGNKNHITTFDYIGIKPDGSIGYNDFAPGNDIEPVFNVNLFNDFFRIDANNIQTNDVLSEQYFMDGNFINQADLLINYFGGNFGFDNVVADGFVIDNLGNIALDGYGYPILYSNFETVSRTETNSFVEVNHGDWVLEAFTSALEKPDLTEIICIDVDTLNGAGNHFSELFNIENSIYGSIINLESVIYDYLSFKDVDGDLTTVETMRFPTLSVSIAGNDVGAVESFALGETYQMPIFQAAPNVGQGSFDWGSFYPDIINVGAWNVDANNELLISSFQTFDTIDIVADGFVLNSEWNPDTSFGTSFATPRVTASYINLLNDYIDQLNQVNEHGTSIVDSPAINYSAEINSLVDFLTSPITFESGGTYTVNLLNETINNAHSIQPVSVDGSYGGYLIENVQYANASPPITSPTSITLDNLTIDENSYRDNGILIDLENDNWSSLIGNISGHHPQGDNLTFTIIEGVGDDSMFTINNDILYLADNVLVDYEHLLWASDTQLEVTLRATDPDGEYIDQPFTINVNNVNEAPRYLSQGNVHPDSSNPDSYIYENIEGAHVRNIHGYDRDDTDNSTDELTYTIIDTPGLDGDMFRIIDDKLLFKEGVSGDYEGSNITIANGSGDLLIDGYGYYYGVYNVDIRGTDSEGLYVDQTFGVMIYDVNEIPTDITLTNTSVDENVDGGVIGVLGGVDPDDADTATLTYSVTGADADMFVVAGTTLSFASGHVADMETKSAYNITLEATDVGDLTYDEDFTINVNNVNEIPTDITLTSTNVDQNVDGAVIGVLGGVDPDAADTATLTYSVTGADADMFVVAGTTLSFASGHAADMETKSAYNITLKATDVGGLTYDEDFTINVNNLSSSGFNMYLALPASLETAEGTNNYTGVYVDLDFSTVTYVQDDILDIADNFEYFMGTTGDDLFIGSSRYASQYDIQAFNGSGGNDQIFGAETTHDPFTNAPIDIKTVADYSSMQGGQGAVFILDGSTVMNGVDGSGDLLYAEIKTAAGDNWNGWRPYDEGTFGAGEKISTESRYDEDKDGASVILDTFGDIDLAFNVDHYIGSNEADIFFGSDEDDIFDAASGSGNYMSGGEGSDKLIVNDLNDGEYDNLDLSTMAIGRAYTYGNYQSVDIDGNGEIVSDAEDGTSYNNLYRIDFAQVNDLHAFIDTKISSDFTPTSTVTSDYELFIRTDLDASGINNASFHLDSANQKIDVASGTDFLTLGNLSGQLVLGEELGLGQYVIQGDDYSTIIDSVEHVILTDNSVEYYGTEELTGTVENPHYGHEYELITGGQGDLCDMLYVTTDQVLNTTLVGPNSNFISGEVYYSGNHSDFDRNSAPNTWASTVATASAATNGVWNGELSQFFVWYDADGEGGVDGYEIAVKYQNGDFSEWTIDNRQFDTFQNVDVDASMADDIKAQFGDDLAVNTGSYRILYEAGFSDIEEIIGSNADVENWNFDFTPSSARSTFYIQVGGDTTADNGSAGVADDAVTNVKVEYVDSVWTIRPDAEILVNLPEVVGQAGANIVIGGNSAETIVGALTNDVMMGRGGSDNYLIASGVTLKDDGSAGAYGVAGAVINEIGGSSEDKSDSITLSFATDIDQLTFTRTEIKNEYYTNTLKIDVDYDAEGQEGYGVIDDTIYVFDHYNQDLGFRAVEQLLLDDGWDTDEIWNLVVGESNTAGTVDEYAGLTGHDILMAGVAESSVLYGGNGQDIMIGDDLSGYTDDGNFTRKTIFELGARSNETDAWDQVADIIQGFGTGDELDLSNLSIYDSADLRKDVSDQGNDELYATVNTVEVKIAEFRDFNNGLGIDDVLNSITTLDVA